MKSFNIYEAKTNLSKLLELVEQGEQVVIARNGKPVADLTPHKSSNGIKFGVGEGQFKYDDASLEGLDPEIQGIFYGKDGDKDKNQITLPVDLVQQFKLGSSRRFTIEKRGNELVLKPEPDALERLQTVWARNKKYAPRSFTDKELALGRRQATEAAVIGKAKSWQEQGD